LFKLQLNSCEAFQMAVKETAVEEYEFKGDATRRLDRYWRSGTSTKVFLETGGLFE